MVQKLKPEVLCRDPEVAQSWEQDPLCHDTGTLEGLAGMLERGDELDRDVVIVKEGRFWVGHGTGDQITSFDASKRWFDRLAVNDKTFKTYEGCKLCFRIILSFLGHVKRLVRFKFSVCDGKHVRFEQ